MRPTGIAPFSSALDFSQVSGSSCGTSECLVAGNRASTARWFEADNNGTSTTPDEVDFYGYENDNELYKAVYNVTRDFLNFPIDMTIIPSWLPIIDDNNGTHSDRVIYTRRKVGTRAKVNWYRGNNARTDNSPPAMPDSSTSPSQTTSYDTTDDPTADPDNPAGDGNGSRHNYTTIGQVNLTYDNNRNVLADGTRQFRYNYKNQLRKVWRKSDGDTTTTGRVAEYREDAFARRVHAQTWWELGRHAYFDTRFELDVNLDQDGDGTRLELVDGGMQSTLNPPPGLNEQRAQWPSLIDRPTGDNEAHYFDFVLDVHQPVSGTVYHGYVAYEEYQLRVFTDRYELWNDASGTLMATVTQGTVGRRNIGLRAGQNSGVWVDGTQIIGGGIPLKSKPRAGFGARALSVAMGNPA